MLLKKKNILTFESIVMTWEEYNVHLFNINSLFDIQTYYDNN